MPAVGVCLHVCDCVCIHVFMLWVCISICVHVHASECVCMYTYSVYPRRHSGKSLRSWVASSKEAIQVIQLIQLDTPSPLHSDLATPSPVPSQRSHKTQRTWSGLGPPIAVPSPPANPRNVAESNIRPATPPQCGTDGPSTCSAVKVSVLPSFQLCPIINVCALVTVQLPSWVVVKAS